MNFRYFLIGIVFNFICVTNLPAQQIKIGNYTFPNGAVYQGEMFKGKPYGKGTTTFSNGDTFTGEYVKGKRQGTGTYNFLDGEKLVILMLLFMRERYLQ